MANVKIEQAASSAITSTLASLASSATFVIGRESAAVDNTTNKYLDYILSGKITTGTTPTVNTEIRVYVVGITNDTTYPDTFTGADGGVTVTNAFILDAALAFASRMQVSATSNIAYWIRPLSVAALFGGVLPKKFSVYVAHNTAVALNATGGNHVLSITGTYETVT